MRMVHAMVVSGSLFGLLACEPILPVVPLNPICEETVTTLGSAETLAPSGWRGSDFLDRVSGSRSLPLDYLPPPDDDGVFVEIEISDPLTQLELELLPDPTSLRWVEAERIYPEGSDMQVEILCDSRFEFEVSVGVSTADGVFAELFETTASAIVDADGALDSLTVPIRYEADQLLGEFEVLSIEPSAPPPAYVFHELWIEYPLAGGGEQVVEPRGYVGGVAEYDLIEYYVIGVFHIALFGGYVV